MLKRILFLFLFYILYINILWSYTKTEYYSLYKPTVGGDSGNWGYLLNNNIDSIDIILYNKSDNWHTHNINNIIGDTITKNEVIIMTNNIRSDSIIEVLNPNLIPDSFITNYKSDTKIGELNISDTLYTKTIIHKGTILDSSTIWYKNELNKVSLLQNDSNFIEMNQINNITFDTCNVKTLKFVPLNIVPEVRLNNDTGLLYYSEPNKRLYIWIGNAWKFFELE